MSGIYDSFVEGNRRTFISTNDLSTTGQFNFCKVDSSNVGQIVLASNATDKVIGVVMNAPKALDLADVYLLNASGTAKAYVGSGGGITMGSEVSGSIRQVVVQRCQFTGTGNAVRFKSQPSRGGVIQDITYRDIQLNDVRQAVEFNMAWRMVPPIAPPAKVLTVVRNVRLINFSGTAQSGGVMRGLPDSPILSVKFENCKVTAQRGLVLENVQRLDLSGLELTVAEGEPIIRRGMAAQP